MAVLDNCLHIVINIDRKSTYEIIPLKDLVYQVLFTMLHHDDDISAVVDLRPATGESLIYE